VVLLRWTDGATVTPDFGPMWGDPAAEVGFRVGRADVAADERSGPTPRSAPALANATTFTDTQAGSTALYSYRVTAYNAAGNSVSQPVLAGPAGVAAPAAPTALTHSFTTGVRLVWRDNATTETGFVVERATVGGELGSAVVGTGNADIVSLTWTDNSLDETGFTIQRSTSAAFTTFTTYTVPANTPTWEQAGVPRNRTFYYRVRATNPGGVSGWSNVSTVTTP
jgi:hypothetical protein